MCAIDPEPTVERFSMGLRGSSLIALETRADAELHMRNLFPKGSSKCSTRTQPENSLRYSQVTSQDQSNTASRLPRISAQPWRAWSA
jgi:hypothetical protein